MTSSPEPLLVPVPVAGLRPTQITIGQREVARKRRQWREHRTGGDATFLGHHMLPVIAGPAGKLYLIDNHHLALALHLEGVTHVLTHAAADLSHLPKETFWTTMDNFGWLHPFDESGARKTYKHIPKSLEELVDDPFRSLAGELRRAGGFAKLQTPFSEFLWADFLRRRIDSSLLAKDFDKALTHALAQAKTAEARYLPGWCGVHDD